MIKEMARKAVRRVLPGPRRDAQPKGVAGYPMTEERLQALLATFEARHAGGDHSQEEWELDVDTLAKQLGFEKHVVYVPTQRSVRRGVLLRRAGLLRRSRHRQGGDPA